MTNDINEDKILMAPGDVCTLLSIKESTLRKYALILQDAGYHFHTNSKGQRGYFDRDVTVLRRFLDIKKAPDMTLEQSANAVMSWLEQSNVSLRVIDKDNENNRYNDDMKFMKETIEQQNILLQKLVEKIDQQQKYIDRRLEERDNKLMESLRESQEVKQQLLQIAAAQEEQKKPRKGFLKWLKK